MKFTKLILLLLLIAMNECITNLETTKKFRNLNLKIKNKKTFTSFREKSTTSTISSNKRKNLIRSLAKRRASTNSRTRAKMFVGAAMLATNIILKVGTDVMNHFINKANRETLTTMKEEYSNNEASLNLMKTKEIDSCAKIKIIIQTNKHFFLFSEYKSIFFEFYKESVEEGSSKHRSSSSKKIYGMLKSMINNIMLLRQNVQIIEGKLMASLSEIENDLCSQEINYIAFQNRNEELEGKIAQMEKLIEEQEESFIGTLLTSGWLGIKNYIRNKFSEKALETGESMVNFKESEVTEPDEYGGQAWDDLEPEQKEQKIEWNDQQIIGVVGKGAGVIGKLKDLGSAIKDFKKEPNKLLGTFVIVAKILNLIASVCNLLSSLIPGEFSGAVGFAGGFFELVGKLIESFLWGYKYAKTPKDSENFLVTKDEFYKSLIEVGVAFLGFFWSGLSGIATEGITFFKKVGDLISAYKRKNQQTFELNYYKSLAQLKIKEQENTNRFKLCLGELLGKQSQFETILELTGTEQKLKSSLNYLNKELLNKYVLDDNSGLFESRGQRKLKESVNKLCEKNIQFCARNFNEAFFTAIGYNSREINSLKDLSINGPYTDIVASVDSEISISFLKLGYEPIAENIYGCRLCSNQYIIRHVEAISDSQSDPIKSQRDKLLEGKTSTDRSYLDIYGDNNGVNDPSYSQFKVIRLNTKNYLVYEIYYPKNPQYSLRKLEYYTRKDPNPTANNLVPVMKIQLTKWNHSTREWERCSNQNSCPTFDYSTATGTNPSSFDQSYKLKLVMTEQVPSANIFGLFPLVGVDESFPIDPKYPDRDYGLDNGNNLAYFVFDQLSDESRIENQYYKAQGKSRQTLTVTRTMKSVVLEPSKYNWLINSVNISQDQLMDLKQGMGTHIGANDVVNIQINSNLIIPPIKSTKGSPVPTEINFEEKSIKYYLVKFEPFKNYAQQDLESVDINYDCQSVCNPDRKNNSCAGMEMSFNTWKKLDGNSIEEFDIKKFSQDYPSVVVPDDYKVTIRKRDHVGNIIYNISLVEKIQKIDVYGKPFYSDKRNFEFDRNDVYVKQIKLEDLNKTEEDQLNLKDEKTIRERLKSIKQENSLRYLFVEKTDVSEHREYDTIDIKISNNTTDFFITRDRKRSFFMRLSDIDDNIYILAAKKSKNSLLYVQKLFEKLPGYVIVDRTFLRDKIDRDRQRFVIVLIKPLPSSGFLPTRDLTFGGNNIFRKEKKRTCFQNIISNITDDFCLKQDRRVCASGDDLSQYEYLYNSNGESTRRTVKFFFKDFTYINLTKVFLRKEFPNTQLDRINVDNFFRRGSNLFKDCDEIDFVFPIIFQNENSDDKQKYRILDIDPSDNSILHKRVEKGPGIKSIYWLDISNKQKPTKLSAANLTAVLNSGYSFFTEVQWSYLKPNGDQVPLYVKIYVNYDYRLKIDKKAICELCNLVSDKLSQNKEEGMLVPKIMEILK